MVEAEMGLMHITGISRLTFLRDISASHSHSRPIDSHLTILVI